GEGLLLVPPDQDLRHRLLRGQDPNETQPLWAYLGRDHLGPVIALMGEQGAHEQWSSLRSVGAVLPAREAGLATAAVALTHWHAHHTHCPRCGAVTIVIDSGWVRQCPRDGSHHFP